MTLKQKKTIEALPSTKYNVRKAMLKGGYSESTSKSGQQYERIHKHLAEGKFFDEKMIRNEYLKTMKQTEKEKDFTNKIRSLEGMARIEALFTDKTQNTTEYKNISDINTDDLTVLQALALRHRQ